MDQYFEYVRTGIVILHTQQLYCIAGNGRQLGSLADIYHDVSTAKSPLAYYYEP